MTLINRRQAVLGASLASAATLATATAADANTRRPPSTSRRQPAPAPVQNTAGVVGTVPVRLGEPSASLSFGGHRNLFVSDPFKKVNLALTRVPASITIANDGNRDFPAGTRVQLRSVVLGGSGLVTGRANPLTIFGANDNVRTFVSFRQDSGFSEMVLSQPLKSGQSLKLDISVELNSNLTAQEVSQIQLRAHMLVSNAAFGYFEVQSPETVLGKQ